MDQQERGLFHCLVFFLFLLMGIILISSHFPFSVLGRKAERLAFLRGLGAAGVAKKGVG
jgi:hypothetical protein